MIMGFTESFGFAMRRMLLPNILVGLLALVGLLVKTLREKQLLY
jgi:hypothetical protein|tara:strand:+ start:723 stop:854 length:132 start_codon:yes stop_codon:yes gene_type:complete